MLKVINILDIENNFKLVNIFAKLFFFQNILISSLTESSVEMCLNLPNWTIVLQFLKS